LVVFQNIGRFSFVYIQAPEPLSRNAFGALDLFAYTGDEFPIGGLVHGIKELIAVHFVDRIQAAPGPCDFDGIPYENPLFSRVFGLMLDSAIPLKKSNQLHYLDNDE